MEWKSVRARGVGLWLVAALVMVGAVVGVVFALPGGSSNEAGAATGLVLDVGSDSEIDEEVANADVDELDLDLGDVDDSDVTVEPELDAVGRVDVATEVLRNVESDGGVPDVDVKDTDVEDADVQDTDVEKVDDEIPSVFAFFDEDELAGGVEETSPSTSTTVVASPNTSVAPTAGGAVPPTTTVATANTTPQTAETAPTTTVRPTGATPATTTTRPPTVVTTSTTAAPVPAGLPTPIGIPGGPVQMGFNVDLWGDERADYWGDLEAVPGNGRLIAHEFKSFTKPLKTEVYEWHLSSGRDLLLTWNGTDAESILDGTHDEWIRLHAQELGALPGTVMLRFWHEPDVSHKLAWIDNDPQQFIDSWMYVREIFVEEGAVDNIEWVWCPTAWNWANQGARFYPGDANVDWICADGYTGWDLDAPLDHIENAYTEFQAWADQHSDKPILVAEFGAGQRDAGERAEWVAGIPEWVEASPNIRAVVYFDYDMRPHGEIYDWRLRTEPDAWQAMMDVLSSAPFGG